MDTARTLAGWVLFLVMAIVAGLFWRQSAERGAFIAEQGDAIARLESSVLNLGEIIASLENDLAEAREATISPTADASVDKTDPAEEGILSGVSLGSLLDSLLGEDSDEGLAADTLGLGGLDALAEMFDGPQGERMLEMSVGVAMDMQYGDLLDMFPPETRDAVREILGEYLINAARKGMRFFAQSEDSHATVEAMETHRQEMLAELRAVIGDDGVAMYEQYEHEMPIRMMDQTLEMQLSMFARNLDADTRDLVRHTMIEEFAAMQPEERNPIPSQQQMRQELQMQEEMYGRALERLQHQLTEEEYGIVHRFVEQQQQMTEMFGSLVGMGAADE